MSESEWVSGQPAKANDSEMNIGEDDTEKSGGWQEKRMSVVFIVDGTMIERPRSQIVEAINSLADNPLPTGSGVKKLKGFKPPLYRLRSGDYHVLYRIRSSAILIARIIDRKELERTIKRLRL